MSSPQFPTYPQQPPPPGLPGPMGPTRPPWWKRAWLLAVAALLLGIAIGAGSASSGSASKVTTVAGPTTTVTATAPAPAPSTVTVTGHPTRVIATHIRVRTVTYTPKPTRSFSDGTYLVGSDIMPGLYQTNGQGDGGGCYWERERDLRGGIDSINANGNIDGPTTVQIFASDRAFKVFGGCEWHDRVN